MPKIRIVVGILCLLLATIFLVANTAILGRYGYKSGGDEFEAIINMIVAASVPTALAMMPIFLAATWRPGHWVTVPRRFGRGTRQKWKRGRPNPIALAGCLLYGVLISFNFLGAIGAISHQKTTVVDEREASKGDAKRWREARQRKVSELEALEKSRAAELKQKHRPSSAVRADLDGAKIHAFWQATDGCSAGKVLQKQQARYCGSIAGWRRELGYAEQIDKLQGEIDELDTKLSSPAARIASVDPQSEVIAEYLNMISRSDGWRASHVRSGQPLVWFLLLELSSMFLLAMGLKVFRIEHADIRGDDPLPPSRMLTVAPALPAEPSPLEVAGVLAPDRELQEAVLSRFWVDCVRPMTGGKEPLLDVYKAYRAYCSRPSNGVPALSFADFVGLSGERQTTTISGTAWLVGIVLSEPMGAVS